MSFLLFLRRPVSSVIPRPVSSACELLTITAPPCELGYTTVGGELGGQVISLLLEPLKVGGGGGLGGAIDRLFGLDGGEMEVLRLRRVHHLLHFVFGL